MARLYSAGFWPPASVTIIDLDTMTRLSGLTLNAGEDDAEWIVRSGDYLYLALYTAPGMIAKVNLLTFTRDSVLTLAADETNLWGLAVSGNFLYTSSYSDNKIIKIDLATFTQVATLALANIRPEPLAVSGNYLYAGHYTNPAVISKINLSTFTVEAVLTLAGERNIECMIISGDFLYAGMIRSPARISKVNLNTFTLDSTLALAATHNRAESMAISGTDLYIGFNTTKAEADPTPIVAKVDLVTFTETAVITKVYVGLSYPVWALQVAGDYLYGGIYLSPGRVEKIRLSDFTIVNTLTLNPGEENFSRSFAEEAPVVPVITKPSVLTLAATGVT